MKRTKEDQAITLIALIITIVVLLILAVVSVTLIDKYNIIQNANRAVKEYNEVSKNENTALESYENTLDKVFNGILESEIDYRIGDLVQVDDEVFYVIKNSTKAEKNVVLLSKNCISTENLIQAPNSSIDKVAFSKSNFWLEIKNIEYPYDLIETGVPDESHYAARAAYDYGVKLGGNGRLLKYSEASELKNNHSDILFSKDSENKFLSYWVGRVENDNEVWLVVSSISAFDYDEYSINHYMNVRPVLEISKTKIKRV